MRTIIIYESTHHGNTKKLVDAIAAENDVETVFLLFTCGVYNDRYTKSISATIADRGCKLAGTYRCLGYDTYGPFKVIGGIAKGHPSDEEIQGAVEFFGKIEDGE